MHRAVVQFHPSATRHVGLLGKNAELQRLSAGCRLRRQASVGAALQTIAEQGSTGRLLDAMEVCKDVFQL